MDTFNALSTIATARKIPPLKNASPTKVMLCALVASIDLQKDLDATKELTGGTSHHQCAKISLVSEVMERAWFMLFPLVR
jgi:hypothetical protein